MRRKPRRGRAGGQSMVEFALVGWFVIMFIFAILAAGITMWEKTTVDYQLTTMADELPDGWQSMDKTALVKKLILDGSTLDESKLTVSDVSVETETKTEVKEDDPVAIQLGSSSATHEEKWLNVSAKVTYDATSPVAIFGKTVYTREVDGSYLTERRYEVF